MSKWVPVDFSKQTGKFHPTDFSKQTGKFSSVNSGDRNENNSIGSINSQSVETFDSQRIEVEINKQLNLLKKTYLFGGDFDLIPNTSPPEWYGFNGITEIRLLGQVLSSSVLKELKGKIIFKNTSGTLSYELAVDLFSSNIRINQNEFRICLADNAGGPYPAPQYNFGHVFTNNDFFEDIEMRLESNAIMNITYISILLNNRNILNSLFRKSLKIDLHNSLKLKNAILGQRQSYINRNSGPYYDDFMGFAASKYGQSWNNRYGAVWRKIIGNGWLSEPDNWCADFASWVLVHRVRQFFEDSQFPKIGGVNLPGTGNFSRYFQTRNRFIGPWRYNQSDENSPIRGDDFTALSRVRFGDLVSLGSWQAGGTEPLYHSTFFVCWCDIDGNPTSYDFSPSGGNVFWMKCLGGNQSRSVNIMQTRVIRDASSFRNIQSIGWNNPDYRVGFCMTGQR